MNYRTKLQALSFQLEIDTTMTEALKDIFLLEPTKENYNRFLKQCYKDSSNILEKFLS